MTPGRSVRMRPAVLAAALAALAAGGLLARPAQTAAAQSSSSAPPAPPITLEVDAREAPRKIFHSRMTIPAAPGPLTLLYPKWLPGEHGPTGPITDVAGLRVTAGGKPLPWRRDPVEMYAVSVDVPAGVSQVEVAFDYLSAVSSGGFSSAASATPELTVISWNQVLLYPRGADADHLLLAASLRLPRGWSHATALDADGAASGGDVLRFAPVSLTTLVDSPVLAGAHFKRLPLTDAGGSAPAHRLNIAADSDAALDISASQLEAYRRLVAETGALFGARHYRHYDFLLTLSDNVAHFGLEHHESSDDRVPERCLVDEDKRKANLVQLLPHEMVHSWNGKYRRPAGLQPGRFDEPMRGELLWVYEGLTQYLGEVLAARSGELTLDQYRDWVSLTAADMEATRGRAWRPLADTAVAAQLLYEARTDWAMWRRGVDFYPESSLLWLEADTLIRRESGGKKSLDDFCKIFYGPPSGPPAVVPYTADDVYAALNRVLPRDWKKFWTDRLESTADSAPLAGITASGWKLAWAETPNEIQKSREEANRMTDVRFSIGFVVNEDGSIPDVMPDSPAAKAGAGPGMRLVAVNGRRWSREILRAAIKASRTTPVELLVENGEFFRTYRLDYSGGERYPRLERDGAKPDLLSSIARAAAPTK
jgi:predicted metalloprotease with PDZ domain